jgi:hypothetical protein
MYRILVSGYWESLDGERVQYLKHLASMGPVIVGVYNDARAQARTDVSLMQRVELMRACKYVSEVYVIENELTAVYQAGITHFGGQEYGEVKAEDLDLPPITFHQPVVVARKVVKPSWLL